MISSQVLAAYKSRFKTSPALLLRSPGRINLIGEHTDYHGGFVLPAAIDKAVYFAVGPNGTNLCRLFALDLNDYFECSLDQLKRTPTQGWANYLMGVIWAHQNALGATASKIGGVDLVFGADLPSGGGLSSSAAIENGMGFALNQLFDLGFSRLDLVALSQKAENGFVGMNCGIMDMFASMMGKKNQFLKIDCRSLDYACFPFETKAYALMLCDSTVKHALVDSAYNTRRRESEAGLDYLKKHYPGLELLRDVSLDMLEAHRSALDPVTYRRCAYVVREISRVEAACQALQTNAFERLGRLMYETHEGLRREYEVSCPELDFMVEKANALGALGARIMGGGFGGCTINLIAADKADDFMAEMGAAYWQQFSKKMPVYRVSPEEGTGLTV